MSGKLPLERRTDLEYELDELIAGKTSWIKIHQSDKDDILWDMIHKKDMQVLQFLVPAHVPANEKLDGKELSEQMKQKGWREGVGYLYKFSMTKY